MAPRKKPFSGKAKKQQLQEKREKNRVRDAWDESAAAQQPATAEEEHARAQTDALVTPTLPPTVGQSDRRDLRTVFQAEPKAAVEARKRDATRALEYASDRGDSQAIYRFGILDAATQPPLLLKPSWHRDMTPDELANAEAQAYLQWTQSLADAQQQLQLERQLAATSDSSDTVAAVPTINMYERNLEVWRQLWRVLDRAAVLVHLADARCPLLHLSDRLIAHILTDRPAKRVVIVLTKSDLVPSERVRAWIAYLETRFAHRVPVLAYSMATPEISTAALLRTIGAVSASVPLAEREESVRDDERDALVIGFVGEPNVGKSSLLNSVLGRKVVSVSATPGHTKHLQTHFFDRVELLELDSDDDTIARVVLCDCPGVVFPRFDVPLALQILFGSFPIAQTREPFSAVRFIAENCVPPLHEIYNLQPVDDDDVADGWSPFTLCEAYAKQRGFHVKRGKFDVHRAANLLLRDTLNGKKAVLSFPPPTA